MNSAANSCCSPASLPTPRSLVPEARLKERLAQIGDGLDEMCRLAEEHTHPADAWVISYGRACMSAARDYIQAHMGELIAWPAEAGAADAAE